MGENGAILMHKR